MPIYEYRCADCGAQHEHLQKLGDAPIAHCPDCGGTHYEKLVSAAGFQLKGSGWYATDFKGGGSSAKSSSSESGDKPATSGGGCCGGACGCH
ncbi:FmdB family zinc ribbon protein [Tepidiphilus margaritifer]|jgi:putative FmdB family regulatory protein|uniref:FmdB family zinc ribbon protein n=1 Tax=Tepidiphilus margaritifer TaxID=203471 RepID=UPI00041A767B|nr:zinc ribbon domain-containing protein [Tepidiphilus margaritifer]